MSQTLKETLIKEIDRRIRVKNTFIQMNDVKDTAYIDGALRELRELKEFLTTASNGQPDKPSAS